MPRRLVYLASAKRDLVEIFEHIARESGSVTVGTRFTEQIRRQCVKLAELPGMLGRARPELHPDIRSFAFGSYVIFFRYENERFEVVNVLEGHRDIVGYYGNNPGV